MSPFRFALGSIWVPFGFAIGLRWVCDRFTFIENQQVMIARTLTKKELCIILNCTHRRLKKLYFKEPLLVALDLSDDEYRWIKEFNPEHTKIIIAFHKITKDDLDALS
jgi:hypothetical protein